MSKTIEEQVDEFRALELVFDACRKCEGLGAIINPQSTSPRRTCDRCDGTGNEVDEQRRVEALVEKVSRELFLEIGRCDFDDQVEEAFRPIVETALTQHTNDKLREVLDKVKTKYWPISDKDEGMSLQEKYGHNGCVEDIIDLLQAEIIDES